MSDHRPAQEPRLAARLGGVVVGVAVYVGVNLATSHAIVPTLATLNRIDPAFLPSPPEPPKPPYQAVCSPCHQPDGQGIPFAFPPLAGSEWITADPETPIRIVLLGLSGQIQVKGTAFNVMMPPPPGLDDARIAEAITYARTNFGNSASAVDAALVKKVRESLGERSTLWTATELAALRSGVPGDAAKKVPAVAPVQTKNAPAPAIRPSARPGRAQR
jgi:mono/diheme cytochrome c family protein